MSKKITIKDVAKASGYSESTVSLVLNNREARLSKDAIIAVREAAKRLGYIPSQIARSLATNRSDTLGLVIPDIENPYFSTLAKKLEKLCQTHHLGLLIANSDNNEHNDEQIIRRLEARGADGVFYVPSSDDARHISKQLIEYLSNLSIPMVMIDRCISDIACDKVYVDNFLGSYLATKHLLDYGHAKIACIASTERSVNGRLRLNGYQQALHEHLGTSAKEFVFESEYRSEDAYAICDEVLESGVSAIFSTSDLITVGLLRRLFEQNIVVSKDISIVSYDRIENSSLFLPGITSIKQDLDQIASHSFNALMKRMERPDQAFSELKIEPELVIDASVARI